MQVLYEKLTGELNELFFVKEFIQSRFTSPFHVHDEYEIILIRKGRGALFVGTLTYTFSPGQTFLLAPGVPHCFMNELENDESKAHAIMIQFKENFLGEGFFKSFECRNLSKLIQQSALGIRFSDNTSLERKMLEIRSLNGLERLQKLISIFQTISNHPFELLGNKLLAETNKLFDSKIINDVYNYVVTNFKDQISFSKAAQIANMQSSAFCRYFKRKTQNTFSEFVNQIRLAHARRLLIETDKYINEIGFECGYNNIPYFTRLFKKRYDLSPNEVRFQNMDKWK